jgi:hypothetical protein
MQKPETLIISGRFSIIYSMSLITGSITPRITTITLERLRRKGYEALLAYYEKEALPVS